MWVRTPRCVVLTQAGSLSSPLLPLLLWDLWIEGETETAPGAAALILALKNTRLGSRQAEGCCRYQPKNKQTNPKPEGQIQNNSQARTSELLVARDTKNPPKKLKTRAAQAATHRNKKTLVNKGMKVKETLTTGKKRGGTGAKTVGVQKDETVSVNVKHAVVFAALTHGCSLL